MTIDIGELLSPLAAVSSPNTRVGLPDDPTYVEIRDVERFRRCLDAALISFRAMRPAAACLVDVEINSYHKQVWIRFAVQELGLRRGVVADGKVEPELADSFGVLNEVAANEGGKIQYWGGDNYFDVNLPYRGPIRDSYPPIEHLPWCKRYPQLLERASWESLRGTVFRSSRLAESIAEKCAKVGHSRILIPSVGLSIHPWIFANQGHGVVATDISDVALAAVGAPGAWPRLFSTAAYERWDISQSSKCAGQGNLDSLKSMPNLNDLEVRVALRERISLLVADWANLPVRDQGVDAIFAINALPRTSGDEVRWVLREWIRVIRPGGFVFIAQHNFANPAIDEYLLSAGWLQTNLLRGEPPAPGGPVAFQTYYSSG